MTILSTVRSKSGTLRLLFALSFLNNCVDADFWRYIVAVNGSTERPNLCDPPIPNVDILSGTTNVRIFGTTGSLSCSSPAGGGLDCRGTGSVTFDVIQPADGGVVDDLFISMTYGGNPFTCQIPSVVAQAYSLGQICPDDTVDARSKLTCNPANAFRSGGNANLCVSSCDNDGTPCISADLTEVNTTVANSGCLFQETGPPAVAPVTTAPVGTAAPVATPAPAVATPAPAVATPAPVASPAPMATPAPVLAPTGAPVTSPPAPECGGYLDVCSVAADCCSNRCVTRQCRKAIPANKNKLSEGRGGAGGVAKESGRRTLFRSVRGME